MKWLIENNKEIKENLDNVSFGTIDSFLLNYLTGNFFTDVSNASRSFLMDIKKVEYSGCLLDVFELKRKNLAEIKPSVYDFGEIKETRLSKYGIKVMAILGD
jgi:glycerol kinase